MFSSTFSEDFTSHFDEACQLVSLDCPSYILDAEQQLILFNSTCSEILDSIASFLSKQIKPKAEPWLNNDTQVCCAQNRSGKKIREILCTSLTNDQRVLYKQDT